MKLYREEVTTTKEVVDGVWKTNNINAQIEILEAEPDSLNLVTNAYYRKHDIIELGRALLELAEIMEF